MLRDYGFGARPEGIQAQVNGGLCDNFTGNISMRANLLFAMLREAQIIPRKLLILIAAASLATPALARELSCGVCGPGDCCPGALAVAIGVAATPEQMQGMNHAPGQGMHMHQPATLIEEILNHGTAGTSAEPASMPHDMLMKETGSWMLMFHGGGFLVAQQQTGARGGDKVFGASWARALSPRE